LIFASVQVAPLSILTSTLDIPLVPAKAIPPTDTILLLPETEGDDVLLLELARLETVGKNPLNLVRIAVAGNNGYFGNRRILEWTEQFEAIKSCQNMGLKMCVGTISLLTTYIVHFLPGVGRISESTSAISLSNK
jgi:hypothetical protein